MAWKELNSRAPGATTLTDLYTVPAGKEITAKVMVVNRGATPTTFRWSLAVGGLADATSQYKAYDTPIIETDIYESPVFGAGPGDVIRVYAGNANLTFSVNGIEKDR